MEIVIIWLHITIAALIFEPNIQDQETQPEQTVEIKKEG